MSKKEWKLGHIFVAFSEYMNFIVLCTHSGKENTEKNV